MFPAQLPGANVLQKLERINGSTRPTKKASGSSEHDQFHDSSDSSFNFSNHFPATSADHPDQYILDITKYIPVGSLRIFRADTSIAPADWTGCRNWAAFPHQKDIEYKRSGSYLTKELQAAFFGSFKLNLYVGLHKAGWIRWEFKSNDLYIGQIRVYILPDDVGRGHISRESPKLRKALQSLLAELDIFRRTWEGTWDHDSPFFHLDPTVDTSKDEESLFEVFNTLPSPKPTLEVLADLSLRAAMNSVLESCIPGLETTLYNYQRRSAAIMIQKEEHPGQVIDPRLTPQVDQKGNTWYCDVEAGRCFKEPQMFEGVRGGICAETMGLGKTLICLSLILATREFSSKIPLEYSVGSNPVRKSTGSLLEMAASRLGQTGTPWKDELSQVEAHEGCTFDRVRDSLERNAGHYSMDNATPSRQSRSTLAHAPPRRKLWLSTTTIVVCPGNLWMQWQSEIRKHTTGLNVFYINATRDQVPPARHLVTYDIILFTKSRFEHEQQLRQMADSDYESPLTQVHFKRLIIDEGHSFGNAHSSKTLAGTLVDAIQCSAHWIVSGTPTNRLGALETNLNNSTKNPGGLVDKRKTQQLINQEREDLVKLGNIATCFLKARPWANPTWPSRGGYDPNYAAWSQMVMQPRHGSKSRGNMHTLRVTLESMIVKHRPEDVSDDVVLPPLHQKVVYLDGSHQNKLSLNTFSLMIIANAVTSAREGIDYFFHAKQKKSLNELVSNLRQASFFWSGFDQKMVEETIKRAREFLDDDKISVTPDDKALLLRAIEVGKAVLDNKFWQVINEWHEMPMFVQNSFSDDVRSRLSLTKGNASNPTLVGATMLHDVQLFVDSQLWKSDPADGLLEAVKAMMTKATHSTQQLNSDAQDMKYAGSKLMRQVRRASRINPTLPNLVGTSSSISVDRSEIVDANSNGVTPTREALPANIPEMAKPILKSAMKKTTLLDDTPTIDPTSPLALTQIVSTGSAKLSYLMDKISLYQVDEKILVFYESENVAYYIAQALECLGIKYLIYAKSLSVERRSQYVVTFNQTETFRVLLMDVSQAAFGLNISSASRVWFVNPVFSPQVEAQAVKRAHRIGQKKPVHVETLVLNGSIEQVIVGRRDNMSQEDHHKLKSILDDEMVYNWIRNPPFQPIPQNVVSGPEQMTLLDVPQPVFGRGISKISDPDADLLLNPTDGGTNKRKGSIDFEEYDSSESSQSEPARLPARKRARLVLPKDVEDDSLKPRSYGKDNPFFPDIIEEEKKDEPLEYEPLDVPQTNGESSTANSGAAVNNWDKEIGAYSDSEEELDI